MSFSLLYLISSSFFLSIYCLEESPSILVIGSGPSGIAAASKLWKYNFTNLRILEAENRIGGRVNSVKFGNGYVDLGGQWCHGETDNIVYNMVKNLNVLKHANSSIKLVYSNGTFLEREIYDNLVGFAESIDASHTNPETEEISRKSDYKRCGGDLLLNWNGQGYKTILEVMLQEYPDPSRQLPLVTNILLNKEVTKIIWSNGTERNSVRCLDNTVYEADHVIFTPSLGVLKANHDKIFEPELPNEKIEAIRSFGFGAIMKIILHFNTTWWNPHETYFFVWSAEDRNNILSEFDRGPNGRSWLTSSIAFVTAENNPKVLLGFFSGEMVPDMERELDEVLQDGCTYILRKFLGEKYSVVEPDDIIKSTWYNNPHFRGTYSYESVKGNSTGNRFPEKLARPLYRTNSHPSIQFAGEATHRSGPSGIAAATKLWKHNFTNLKILEAEDRIGGRIKSIKFGDAYVDLGAQSCHGEKDNIVYHLVNQYNILKHSNFSLKMVYSNGEFIDDEICKNLVDFVDFVNLDPTDPKARASCQNTSSVGECFAKDDYSSFSSYDISRKSSYKTCEGDLYLNWDGLGYKTILEIMLQEYPDRSQQLPVVNNILLNKEVTKIIWSNNTTRNVVHCLDNTVYEADYVIFTASVGVLKASSDKMFEPKLPDEKLRAIRSIGFGAIMKIIFHFPTTWWNPNDTYAFIWSAEDKKKIPTKFGKGPVKNGRSWLTTSAAFITAENNPKVLMGYFSGVMVPEMEKESDQILQDGCMYMFRTFLGKTYSVIEPDNMIKSTWYSNPHFRGTYSYESVKSNSAENRFPEELASPLIRENGNPSVLFAGEATHPYYFSTVHGAIETGYREADRIIDLYSHNK
ncbi:hypothetical protein NQ314_020287 [Rhamnusium bicolor]|uniref:Amine oxidase domain-containing protein n=1 Tax=Rhamnusium bicolor TaxID=1586634 RepID=A0AAV8WL99_9CUCU|nr:hypothetical protein NQ314_020287 [Rhamnusium bicolor]